MRASGLAVSGYMTMQAKTATKSISSSYNAFLKGEPVDPNIQATGDVGQIEAWMKTYMATQAKDRLAYESELDGAGLSNLLLPAHLKADADLSQSKATIVRGREIVKKYHTLFDSRVTEAYGIIGARMNGPSGRIATGAPGLRCTAMAWSSTVIRWRRRTKSR
jgi:hypothetical protein